ncbi:CopG family antitoxin [Pararhizobium sp.]|uniref:CopG family antitoxin n=1 Tax=Pararhizobium sp. TaxID=1977563 RepID=UPI002722B469|nr:CopG family antitoxin [Pararhizobium sp.]MDO9414780.1 CopG family antitoxin [Pararhizobium sp.]
MADRPRIGTFVDAEEEAFFKALETAPFTPKSFFTPERRQAIEAQAAATINDEREKISLRISRSDLTRLKSLALQEGVPYQTLINSILHKYVSG